MQLLADAGLHDVIPPLFFTYWWFAVPKGRVRFADIPHWWTYPIGYLVYSLIRGELIGSYVYPFIDVNAVSYGLALGNGAGILLGFSLIAAILVGVTSLKKGPVPSAAT